MGIEVTGKLHVIMETKQVSERFTKREIIVEVTDNPKYPQFVQFQLTGDRCSLADDLQVGDQVRIEFSLRGREWRSPQGETKYFNSLDIWKIELARQNMGAGSGQHRARNASGGGNESYGGYGGGGGGNRDAGASGSFGGAGGGGGGGGVPEMPAHMRDEVARPDDDIPF
jgi:single-stranded DNA-binding protein